MYRLSPKEWQGHKLSGRLGYFDELPDFETIRDHHGGGRFRLVVKKPDSRGRLVYAGCATAAIAGEPRVPESAPLTTEERSPSLRSLVEAVVYETLEDRLFAMEQVIARVKHRR